MKKLLIFTLVLLMVMLSGCTTKIDNSTDDSTDENKTSENPYNIEVSLKGGSGKTTVMSPTQIEMTDDEVIATIVWSSPHYDYMLVNEIKYTPVNVDGNATFEIPVVLDEDMVVIADTTAMSEPHEISYTLYFDSSTLNKLGETGDSETSISVEREESSLVDIDLNRTLGNGWVSEERMAVDYAKNFGVDYYSGGYTLISVSDGSRYLLVPEGAETPENLDGEITVLHKPLQNIYLVATSAMCLFDDLDALDRIRLSGTKAEDWYIPNAKASMQEGKILYAGKYRSPDYELIMTNKCGLAIESTMINHNPEVKEKLEEVGIPVFIDQSSYETHPLGRTEWIKLYGVLTDREDKAKELFDEQSAYMDDVSKLENTGQTVAYFYINAAGDAVTRKSGDYVAKMIELAGGKYIFDALSDSTKATSTINLEMEQFYATAKEADYIIYNSTIGGEITSMEELLSKNSLLREFKAVKNNHVWCTDKNLYQETTELGLMIWDIHQMLTEGDTDIEKLNFMYKLK